MNKLIYISSFLILAITLSACSSDSDPTPRFEITTDKSRYEAGETVRITMKNNVADTIDAFGCGTFNYVYQQLNDDDWSNIESQICGPLTPRDYYPFLAPGEEIMRTITAGGTGRYRYGVAAEPGASSFPPETEEYTFVEFRVN